MKRKRASIVSLVLLSCISVGAPSRADITQMPANWQQLSQKDLAGAVSTYYRTHWHFLTAVATRQQVAQFVWNNYLSTDQSFQAAFTKDRDGFLTMAAWIAPDLQSASKKALATRLQAIAGNSSQVKSLPAGTVKIMFFALKQAGVTPGYGRQMVESWISTKQSMSASSLADFAGDLSGDNSSASSSAQQVLINQAWTKFLGSKNYPKKSDFVTLNRLLDAFGSQLTATQKQQISSGVIQRYQQADRYLVEYPALQFGAYVVPAMRSMGATDAQMADVVRRWAVSRDKRATYDDSDLFENMQLCLDMLKAGASNVSSYYAAIGSDIQANGGASGPVTAQALAYSAYATGTLSSLNNQLASQLNTLQGDALAMALFAQANTVELQSGPWGNHYGEKLAEQALAAAQSDKMRLAIGQYLIVRAALATDTSQCNAYAAQLSAQLTDKTEIAQLPMLNAYIEEEAARLQHYTGTTQPTTASQLALQQLQMQLDFAKNELAQAQLANRPVAVITNLQNVETALEQQVSSSSATQPASNAGQ